MGNQTSSSSATGTCIENDISVVWKKIKNENPFPCVEGQCCCTYGNKMYVYGGVLQSDGEDMTESNELLSFDIDSNTWQKVACKNKSPQERSAASLVAVGNKLYLFGGLNQTCGWLDDFHVFDTETLKWSAVQAEGKGPSPRDKLQGVVVGTKIYYFGGFGPKSSEEMEDDDDEEYEDEEDLPDDQDGAEFGWFNDLFVFDTVAQKWSQPMQMNLGVPTQRAAHGMCAVGEQLVIFGGRDTDARQNDIHIFNTGAASPEHYAADTEHSIPLSHIILKLNTPVLPQFMIVKCQAGGEKSTNSSVLETRKWEMDMDIKGRLPAPRSFHTTTAVGNRVVVMGGRGTDNKHLADLHVFDMETREWLQPKVEGDLPNGRGLHSVGVVKDTLILYGGSSKFSAEIMQCQEFHKDTYVLKTDELLKGGAIKQNGHAKAAAS